ncbi:MAG: carboxypeptidase regulatory-like domain-containing protein, partial [Acidobacteriota bacterium]
GVVVDEKTRRPVSRVRIEALDDPFPLPGMPPVRQAKTDSRGRFRLAGLSRREYTVMASRRDYLGSSLPAVAASPPSGPLRIALVRGAGVSGRVVDEAGAAVAGARVRVLPGEGRRAMRRNRPTRASAPSALTRADGSFELRGLPPGESLSISASRAGYLFARRDGVAATAGKGKPLTLVLRRGNEARGRVVDSGGDAISGVEVSLSRSEEHRVGLASWSGEDPDSTRNAVTDGAGRFVLKALEPGKYAARIKHPAYATTSIPALRVERSGVTQWDPFVLQPSAPVAGVVRNKKGEPVTGASVESFGPGGGVGQAQSDVQGRFRLDGYGAGTTFTLKVEAEGYALSRQSVKAPAPDLSIVLSTAGVLRGRVENVSTRQPVAEFAVGGRFPHGLSIESRDFRSEDGSFELSDVPPGKITLTASAPGYLDGSLAGIEVGEGEVKEGIVLSLRKGRSISGRVLDPRRGTGVPNATVSWRRISEQDRSGFAVGPGGAFVMVSNAATTDADGRFQYDAVPPEKLIFKASHPDFLEAERTVDASAESAVDITLAQGGSISGVVVAGDGRSLVSGAEVGLQDSGAPPSALAGDQTHADEGGGFRFEHLKEGRYRLTARDEAGRAASTEVVLMPGQSADGVLLELSAGATLRGRVTGLRLEKLSGLTISAYRDDYQATTKTEPDGTFVLSGVPPGAVLVSATPARWEPGGRSVSKNVEVPEGAAEVPVELAFEGSSRLEVRVTRRGEPLPWTDLRVHPDPMSSPGLYAMNRTDADGRAAFDGLLDGAYLLVGAPSQGARFSRPIAVSGDTSIEIALGAGSVSGIVTDATSGEVLSDVSVAAETGEETSGWLVPRSRTDSQGYYRIDDLDPGSLQVTARRDGYRQKTLPVNIGDAPAELSFALSRGGGLAVHASDGVSGLPLSGLFVMAFSDSGAMSFSGAVALDAQGDGEIASLAPGTYSLYVFSTGYGPRTVSPVHVPSAPLSISLTPGGRVEVRAGSAAVGRLLDGNGMPYLSTPGRLDGRVAIAPPVTVWDHLAPGSYRVIVEGEGGEKSYSFSVAEGQTTRLEVP